MTESLSLPRIELSMLYADENEFEERLLGLLRLKDIIGIKQIGFIAEEEVISKWESTKGKTIVEVKEILDRHVRGPLDKLLVASSLLIQYDNIAPFQSLVSNFSEIYQIGGKGGIPDAGEEHLSSSVIWKEIVKRIYALGALAVLFEKFEAIPILIMRPWPKEYPEEIQKHRFWAKHAFSMLARERRLQPPSLCLLAEEEINQNGWFFKKFKRDLDLFRNAVCRFDFLQCAYALSRSGRLDDIFPGFGIFNNWRTEPIVLDLVVGGKSRTAVPDVTDSKLAEIIASLDRFAAEKFSGYNGWDQNGWTSKEIREFLKKNVP